MLEFVTNLISEIPATTLYLLIVTGSLILSVIVGSGWYMKANRRKASKPAPEPVVEAAASVKIEKAVAAYTARVENDDDRDEAVLAWETELDERIDDLEEVFAKLADKLSRLDTIDADGNEVLRVLSQQIVEGQGDKRIRQFVTRNSSPTMTRQQGRLSEEQAYLLRRVSGGKPVTPA